MVDPTPMVGRLDFYLAPTSTPSWTTVTFPVACKSIRIENVGANSADISFDDNDTSPAVHGVVDASEVLEFPDRQRRFIRHRSTAGTTLQISAW